MYKLDGSSISQVHILDSSPLICELDRCLKVIHEKIGGGKSFSSAKHTHTQEDNKSAKKQWQRFDTHASVDVNVERSQDRQLM